MSSGLGLVIITLTFPELSDDSRFGIESWPTYVTQHPPHCEHFHILKENGEREESKRCPESLLVS